MAEDASRMPSSEGKAEEVPGVESDAARPPEGGSAEAVGSVGVEGGVARTMAGPSQVAESAPEEEVAIGETGGAKVVSPKPATWKSVPAAAPWCPEEVARQVPELEHFAYEDLKAQTGRGAGEWLVAGASRRGRLHAHLGTHREDAFAFVASEGCAVLCVADGAGSSKHSRIASEITCREMTQQLAGALLGDESGCCGEDRDAEIERMRGVVQGATREVCRRLREVAAAAGCEPRDFYTTMLVGIQVVSGDRESIYVSQVGDGGICALSKSGAVQAVELADSGEFSGQVTCFVPEERAESKAGRLHVFDGREIDCLLLCSDGVEDPFYPMQRKARAIFQQLYLGVRESLPEFQQASQAAPLLQADVGEALLGWLDFTKRGENDDRTMVLLYRPPGEAEAQALR